MKQTEFLRRREALFRQMLDESIAIVHGAKRQRRNGDSDYPFRQDSTFYYLTGFSEPDAWAVFIKESGKTRFILCCAPKNPEEEVWTGIRVGFESACSEYGADEAFSSQRFDEEIVAFLSQKKVIYSPWGGALDAKVGQWLQASRQRSRKVGDSLHQWLDLRAIVDELRLFKSEEELSLIQAAVDISVVGHEHAMRRAEPGLHEYHLHSSLMSALMDRGVLYTAYPTIVGSGANACVLHYTDNNAKLHDGELVLIDAGAEVEGYAADITRTFPVNGRFSAEQRALYDIVLASQKAAIELIRPGLLWGDIQRKVVEVLVDGLIDVGILKGTREHLIETQAYTSVYMHGSGHWLGLDVHDVGAYKQGGLWRALESNMVLTVEPGLYIQPLDSIDERWHHIGIRIEDDVLVTRDGNTVLSQALVKEPNDVEDFLQ